MKTKCWLVMSLMAAWLSCAPVQGQQPAPPVYPPPAPIPGNGEVMPINAPPLPPPNVLSDWLQYNSAACAAPRDCCEGHRGKQTPLYTELYLRAGPSMPVSGTLGHELQTGWSIVGGGRALFYDAPMTRAWTVDVHIINTDEYHSERGTQFPLTVFTNGVRLDFGKNGLPGVTVRRSNRTMAGLGLGREWYLLNSADSDHCRWRVGLDGGGRWGSHRLDLNETRHVTDVIYSWYAAVHTDLECPTHYATYFIGARLEYAQTYSDILQTSGGNVADLSAFLELGLRF